VHQGRAGGSAGGGSPWRMHAQASAILLLRNAWR
jgi:hypothetical protein